MRNLCDVLVSKNYNIALSSIYRSKGSKRSHQDGICMHLNSEVSFNLNLTMSHCITILRKGFKRIDLDKLIFVIVV